MDDEAAVERPPPSPGPSGSAAGCCGLLRGGCVLCRAEQGGDENGRARRQDDAGHGGDPHLPGEGVEGRVPKGVGGAGREGGGCVDGAAEGALGCLRLLGRASGRCGPRGSAAHRPCHSVGRPPVLRTAKARRGRWARPARSRRCTHAVPGSPSRCRGFQPSLKALVSGGAAGGLARANEGSLGSADVSADGCGSLWFSGVLIIFLHISHWSRVCRLFLWHAWMPGGRASDAPRA